MRFFIILAAILATLSPVAAEAAIPAFSLSFKFDPPLGVGSVLSPAVYLDVCATTNCSSILRSFDMNCSAEHASTGNAPVIIGCMVHAESLLRLPESAYTLLSHPATLRVRSNNLVSQVFQFSGGQAVSPETFYNFLVTPSASGFLVTN